MQEGGGGEKHLLIPSDKAKSGYKGVNSNHGRYMAQCNTSPCHHYYLGNFGTPEEAAQVYLQHWEKEHPEELAKERARPLLLPVQEHLLIRSDKYWLQGSVFGQGTVQD